VDPLVAYKRETFDTFQGTLKHIREQASKMVFMVRVDTEEQATPNLELTMDAPAVEAEPGTLPWPTGIDPKTIGRNDPCPCGSGHKFKNCHYFLTKQS
jgi:preprotein translocase subunit SecA